jgi:hypothetical protein
MFGGSTVPSTEAKMRVWSRLSWACARIRTILRHDGCGMIELVTRHFNRFLRRFGRSLSCVSRCLCGIHASRANATALCVFTALAFWLTTFACALARSDCDLAKFTCAVTTAPFAAFIVAVSYRGLERSGIDFGNQLDFL